MSNTINMGGPSGGTITFRDHGKITAPIPYDASVEEINKVLSDADIPIVFTEASPPDADFC